jgi:hypothetical protein
LNLRLSSWRSALNFETNIHEAQTAQLRQGTAPSLATQRLDQAQTRLLTPRMTMADRVTTRLHEVMTVTAKRTRPYVSLMLAATALIFVVAIMLWRSVHAPVNNIAYAANEPQTVFSLVPVALPTPASPWGLVDNETHAVTDASYALVKDQQFAVIEPHGQLAVALTNDQFFGNGANADLLIHGATERKTAYRIFVRDNENVAWQRIDVNRKGFAQGTAQHDMGHHGIARARQVMIRNDSDCVLQLDGITAIFPNLVATAHSHRH